MPDLTPDQRLRYSRHLTLPQVGVEGQARLREAAVLLVGAGGLGSPAALYLAAAGVGRLGLVEFDTVERSNLQRQVLYEDADVGAPKADRAAERLRRFNPDVDVRVHPEPFAAANAFRLVDAYDVVLDGSDNFTTRYLVNDACVLRGKPDVYGSVFRFEGQVSVFGDGDGPCYRCLFPEPPAAGAVPDCAEGGVLGVLPGTIGTLQAAEAVKRLLGIGEPLVGRLLLFDALAMRFRELRVPRDPDCPLCGERPSITSLREERVSCGTTPDDVEPVEPRELATRLSRGGIQLLDVRNEAEWRLVRLPGARWMPLPELRERAGELDPTMPTVVYCKVGARGARAARLLRELGFEDVSNLAGGLERWGRDVDPDLPRY